MFVEFPPRGGRPSRPICPDGASEAKKQIVVHFDSIFVVGIRDDNAESDRKQWWTQFRMAKVATCGSGQDNQRNSMGSGMMRMTVPRPALSDLA